MVRKIHCHRCNLYLGEIRDATLRKDIGYVCWYCLNHWERPQQVPEDPKEFVEWLTKGAF